MKKIVMIVMITATLIAGVHYDKRPNEKNIVKYDKRFKKVDSVVKYDNNTSKGR